MEEVKRLLATTRLVTLTGPGGCGKTRLAVEVAADLLRTRAFSDGVWWVELAALADPALLPHTVASVLGVRETSGRPMTEALISYVRPRTLLLVLDNCEHLVAACAELTEVLLGACPDLRILVTSRETLCLTAETAWPVPSLSLPPAADPDAGAPGGVLVEEVVRSEAGRLFIERAAARLPGFSLTEKSAHAVAAVCRRLDGIPLAIELAAARVNVLPAEHMVERLDDALRLLTTGSRRALPRHQTLQTTIDWSYQLLTARQRALLRRLSIFAGSFSLEAVEAVCALGEDETASFPPDIAILLFDLVNKSLVTMQEQADRARYRLLETIRQYGWALLDAPEAAALQQKHASFFLNLAETAAPGLLQADRSTWLSRLDAEYDNLRAALQWAMANDQVETLLRLAGALWWFWFHRGLWSEGHQWLTRVLTAAAQTELPVPDLFRARALLGVGVLSWVQGDHPAARAQLEECVSRSRSLEDRLTLAHALHFLSQELLAHGEGHAARTLAEESVAIFREEGDVFGLPASLVSLGIVMQTQKEYASATARVEESAALFRAAGDTWGLSLALRNLGIIALRHGRYEQAAALLKETLVLLRDLAERRWFISRSVESLAETLAMQGDHERAARLFGAAEALREAIGASVLPAYRSDYDLGAATIRAGLDADTFAAAWAEGRAMSQEQAIAYALEETGAPESEADLAPRVTAEVEAAPELRIYALGPAEVYRRQEIVPPGAWGYAKPRELLFYLLLHGPKRKDQIGLALWPEASPAQLRSSFHVTLHHLRRALGRPAWIAYEHGRYRFNRSLPYWLDIEAFEGHLAEARRLQASEPREALRHLEEAVTLYRGDLLEDLGGDWHLPRQAQVRQQYLEALLMLGGLLTAEGRHSQALEAYRRATLHDSYFEAAHRELMRSYARLGERSQALLHYQRLVVLLKDELGVPPETETVALFEQLQRGEPVGG